MVLRIQHIAVVACFFLVGLTASATPRVEDDLGRRVWKANCQGCHGPDGRARTKVGVREGIADFTSAAFQRRSDGEIKQVILEGSEHNPKMKAYKDRLSPEEISAVLELIRELRTQR